MRKRMFISTVALAVAVTAGACASRVYIRIGPPPALVEVRSPQPGEIYAWIQGFWTWDGSVYVWSPGRWVRAPHSHATWIPGEWREGPRGFYWIPGRWSR